MKQTLNINISFVDIIICTSPVLFKRYALNIPMFDNSFYSYPLCHRHFIKNMFCVDTVYHSICITALSSLLDARLSKKSRTID